MNPESAFVSPAHAGPLPPAINGLVLCGGLSTRMGRDKGELRYREKPQREYVYGLLLPRCESVFISCTVEQSKHIDVLPKIEDSIFNRGPLGGILSAFQYDSNKAWLAVACDLPFLDSDTIDYLIRHRNPFKPATAFWNAERSFPEPLVAIWEPRVFPALLECADKGCSSPGKILLRVEAELLKAPDASVFRNVNTEEEYTEALALFRKPL